MTAHTFKIRGMDCAEEVAILKRELGPIAGGEDRLAFDLINGKITVQAPESVSEDQLRQSVSKTGMEAVPWDQHVESQRHPGMESFWQRHLRTILCAASGIALIAATAWHAVEHGLADAFGAHADPHTYPPAAIVLYAIAIVTGGRYVFPKAMYSARRLRPDMNLLMTIAVTGAVIIGEWFEAAAVAFLFALALLLESWSVSRARKAIAALMELAPATARYICPNDGCIEEKPVEDVPVGVTAVVRPGEKIPLDGVVTEGLSTVNQAPITGESAPIEKSPGEQVFAGAINNDGVLQFTVTKPASDTTLARIIRMVEEAQARRAPSEQWVEKFARIYTPAMLVLAAAVALVPPLIFAAQWNASVYQALVILVIACPCALVISTPVSIVAGLTTAARNGVLIKGGAYLEAPAHLRAIAFDKTGTLTRGHPAVQQLIPLNGHTREQILGTAAALEAHSQHPIARAILQRAHDDNVTYQPATDLQTTPGKGAEGYVNGRLFWIGSHRYLHEKSQDTEAIHEQTQALEDAGHSVIALGNGTHVCGLITLADQLRPQAPKLVRDLKKAGIEHIQILTGDNETTARAIAQESGIDDVRAQLLPHEKVEAVQTLTHRYRYAVMVGDGVNDAPAMASAPLAIAMGAAGTDAAIETADIALMADDIDKLPWLIRHSRRTLRTIQQNIAFALGLKAVFIVLALLGLATLWMAIAADTGASLLVIANALRLLRPSQ